MVLCLNRIQTVVAECLNPEARHSPVRENPQPIGLSAWLNIKPSTLNLWAQGKIPRRKIHGLIRFERDKVTEWLESFEGKSPASMPRECQISHRDLDRVIEAATRDAHTPPPRGDHRQRAKNERRKTVGLVKRGNVWWMNLIFLGRRIGRWQTRS